MDNFANGIGKFEYPVLLVDKSKDESGKEGVLLTPENLYYSAWMTSYYIPVMEIESIQAVTGLLNRGIYVYQKNGSKTKLPLAVEHEEMEKICKGARRFCALSAGKKPFSRKESYLATFEDIEKNDFNLNIPRYVDNFEKEEEVDLNALLVDMKKTDEELGQVQGEFLSLLKDLTSSDASVMASLNDLIGKMEG